MILASSIVFGLSGCTSIPKATPLDVVPVTRPVLQQTLISPCSELPAFESRVYSQGETVDVLTEWITLYNECSYKHAELVKFLQNYLSVK